jgi:hypothetical protein
VSKKKYIYNKKINTYRSDICIDTENYKLANLVRALNYEKIPYKIINNELPNSENSLKPYILKHFKRS